MKKEEEKQTATEARDRHMGESYDFLARGGRGGGRYDFGWMERMLLENLVAPGLHTEAVSGRSSLEQAEVEARRPVEQYLLKGKLKVDWRDVVGNEEAHRAMIEAIEFPIKHKELFKFYGKKATKGILLSGPPGCGKTMFGKAAASVIGQLSGKEASMLSINATELQKPYVGQTEEIIRQLFAYAKAYKALYGHSLVLFIDEADSILPRRDAAGRGVARWEESNVSTFLAEMDGMEESGALVILATNRPEAIDPAILRDGRIDRKIVVKRPDERAALTILSRAMADAPIHDTTTKLNARTYLVEFAINELFSPLRHIVKVKTERGVDYMTLGDVVSGAMVVGLVERAKASAFHRDISSGTKSGITEADMLHAIETVMAEQMSLPDVYALTELAQRLKSPVLELDRVHQPELKYAGTLQ
jgi:SpoVK/Ycf46/Vps4 family AAA+-type ATPase